MDKHCHKGAGIEALENEKKWCIHGVTRVACVLCVISRMNTTVLWKQPTVTRDNAANTLRRKSRQVKPDDKHTTNAMSNPLFMQ
jgi:hypothetical protein